MRRYVERAPPVLILAEVACAQSKVDRVDGGEQQQQQELFFSLCLSVCLSTKGSFED